MKHIIRIRHSLHSIAELSGHERKTMATILRFLIKLKPGELHSNAGGYGIIAVFGSASKKPAIAFRADTDALPLCENNRITYRSKTEGVSHLCGHDGHSAILCALAEHLSRHRPLKNNVMLIFQPSEENGLGAEKICEHPAFRNNIPDLIFGLHNLPGFPENSIIIKNGNFCYASTGLTLIYTGKNFHASNPDNSGNPLFAASRFIGKLETLKEHENMITLCGLKSGSGGFGSSPAEAELLLTLRAEKNEDLQLMLQKLIEMAKNIPGQEDIRMHYRISDAFPCLVNNSYCVDLLRKTSKSAGLSLIEPTQPFRWSEDFAHYGRFTKTAFFGLGCGIHHPGLHTSDYDFNDRIIKTGRNIMIGLMHQADIR
jgi:amidohydrolase